MGIFDTKNFLTDIADSQRQNVSYKPNLNPNRFDFGNLGNAAVEWWKKKEPLNLNGYSLSPTDTGFSYKTPEGKQGQYSWNPNASHAYDNLTQLGTDIYFHPDLTGLRNVWNPDNFNTTPPDNFRLSGIPVNTGIIGMNKYDMYNLGGDFKLVPKGTSPDFGDRVPVGSYAWNIEHGNSTAGSGAPASTSGGGNTSSSGVPATLPPNNWWGTQPAGLPATTQGTNPTTDMNQNGMSYHPGYSLVNADVEDLTKYGLQLAGDIAGKTAWRDTYNFPGWWGAEAKAPTQFDYVNYVGNEPMQKMALPGEYQGLMGGDYNKLQEALATPGRMAAEDAYNQELRTLKNIMGARGLYGSSMMGQQANEGLAREHERALALNEANAAANRYQMEQQGKQFGANYGLQRFGLGEGQNLDIWKTGVTDAGRQQDYLRNRLAWLQQQDEAQRQFGNSMLQGNYNYELAKQNWKNMIDEMLMNRALAVAGRGAPLTQAAQNYRLAQQAADANETAGFWGMALNPDTWDVAKTVGNYAKSGWDWLTS